MHFSALWACGRRMRGVVLAALAAASLVTGASAFGASIEDIRFTSLPNEVTEIELDFDGTVPEPAGYSIDQPARIALDLMGTTSALESKYHSLGTGNARSVTVVQAQDRTRVIVNLLELVPYETEVRGRTMVLRVGAGNSTAMTVPAAQTVAGAGTQATAAGARIEDIDFRRGDKGEGRVVITLSDPKAPIDVRNEGGDIRVEVSATSLPVALRRRLDVSDFATPVQSVDAVEEAGRAVITIRPEGDYDFLAYQADETLIVNVREVRPDDEGNRLSDAFLYKGEKLSLNFQDIEVRSVLQLIADFTDLNLVASDTVSGRITLRLQNVPWDQALDIVLRTKGLDKRQLGNVLMVGPAAEIAAREKQELDNKRQIEELAPLRTEFIQVRYANAQEMVALFESTGDGEAGMLSERGSIIVDGRTNAIIISETADRLTEIRRVLQQLDIPIRQVQIEARIVTANTSFTEQLGIRWGGGTGEDVDGSLLSIAGNQANSQTIRESLAGGTAPVLEDSTVINLPSPGASSTFAIGLAGADYVLDLELSALASDGNAEVVARPKVITSDKQTATISSGVQIPYQEASSSGASTTSFQEAVLSLEVTPQITPDNRIIMDLVVNQDSVGQIFNGIPSINTNEVATQVLVDNGQTLVLGGIFTTASNKQVDKTPFFGDLPVVGSLFRRRIESDDKQELLIFITPRIIQDALTRR
ncbi:MAG TPA: type IV pilus secretin PilQ [Pseudomonadales bacterium]|nr:type IV pilus secretin PilQ [Pseudomonadales bacterium]